ncbi:MAG: hypothetical protein ATN35_13535 [Epulopiscium sp. Nele67-Bin004]|nr:MAG: hypothetical protein ATN35_13535 [Epulopiscium sp. Nele67-Bin004]
MEKLLKQNLKIKDNKFEPGFFGIYAPPGTGKTYVATRLIITKQDESKRDKPAFWLTGVKSVLPVEEFKQAYRDIYPNLSEIELDVKFTKEVLVVKAINEEVINNIIEIYSTIPNKYKSLLIKEYRLLDLVNLKKDIVKLDTANVTNVKISLQKEIEYLEKNYLRKGIKYILKDLCGDKEKTEVLKNIQENSELSWIGKLYPVIYTSISKIVLMSVSKFCYTYNTLVDKSTKLYNSNIIDGALIVIDEFDQAKDYIKKAIIDDATNGLVDYREILKALVKLEKDWNFSPSINEVLLKDKELYSQFLEERKNLEYLTEKYKLNMVCKTLDEHEDSRKIMWSMEGDQHNYIGDLNKTHIRMRYEKGRIAIYIETLEQFKHNFDIDLDIIPYQMMRECRTGLTTYLNTIRKIAQAYTKNQHEVDKNLEIIYKELGFLNHLHLKDYIWTLSDQVQKNVALFTLDEEIDVYKNGFRFDILKDCASHKTYTEIHSITIDQFPESILVDLCNQAKVIALSATLPINSVLCNFDLSYLEHKINNYYFKIQKEDIERIEKRIINRNEKYKDFVKLKVVDENSRGPHNREDIETFLYNILGKNKISKNFIEYIDKIEIDEKDGESSKNHIFYRYCTLFASFKEFALNPKMYSMLSLHSIGAKDNGHKFDLNKIKEYLEIIIDKFSTCDDLKKVSINDILFTANTNNIKVVHDKLQNSILAGNRCILLTTYQSIARGINLQHAIPSNFNLGQDYICIDENFSVEEKNRKIDFSCVMLGEITHKHPSFEYIDNDEITSEYTNYLNVFMNLIELYESGNFSRQQFIDASENLYLALKDKTKAHISSAKYKSIEIPIQKARGSVVVQSIGRINRTMYRSKNITVLTVQSVLDNTNLDDIKSSSISPELKLIKEYQSLPTESEVAKVDRAMLNILRKCNDAHKKLTAFLPLANNWKWSEERKQQFEMLGELGVKHFFVSEELYKTNILFQIFWIPIPKGLLNKDVAYSYNYKNNYENITELEFDKNKFRYEVSLNATRLDMFRKNHIIRDEFDKKGVFKHINFDPNKQYYMPSPILFNNIIKGRLGEIAGKAIINSIQKGLVEDITNLDLYERVDAIYKYGDKIGCLDFKNYTTVYGKEVDSNKFYKKAKDLGSSRIVLINILEDNRTPENLCINTVNTKNDVEIIVIPYLINNNGSLNSHYINELKNALFRQ